MTSATNNSQPVAPIAAANQMQIKPEIANVLSKLDGLEKRIGAQPTKTVFGGWFGKSVQPITTKELLIQEIQKIPCAEENALVTEKIRSLFAKLKQRPALEEQPAPQENVDCSPRALKKRRFEEVRNQRITANLTRFMAQSTVLEKQMPSNETASDISEEERQRLAPLDLATKKPLQAAQTHLWKVPTITVVEEPTATVDDLSEDAEAVDLSDENTLFQLTPSESELEAQKKAQIQGSREQLAGDEEEIVVEEKPTTPAVVETIQKVETPQEVVKTQTAVLSTCLKATFVALAVIGIGGVATVLATTPVMLSLGNLVVGWVSNLNHQLIQSRLNMM